MGRRRKTVNEGIPSTTLPGPPRLVQEPPRPETVLFLEVIFGVLTLNLSRNRKPLPSSTFSGGLFPTSPSLAHIGPYLVTGHLPFEGQTSLA